MVDGEGMIDLDDVGIRRFDEEGGFLFLREVRPLPISPPSHGSRLRDPRKTYKGRWPSG